jgi:predicted AlkP superfamily pyrophosphatase or phosphodiesterase
VSLVLAASVVASAQTPARPSVTPASTRPALIVLLMVDQMRADYVDRYGSGWTGGLHRLFGTGAVMTQAAYPYAATETCPGHATVGSGAFPRTTGIVANGWYDRATQKPVVCTDDNTEALAFGGGAAYESHGSRNFKTPTLADELRMQQPGGAHVVSLALKARSAIGLGGHGGDIVGWFEDSGAWATSTSYGAPKDRAADTFVQAHPVDAYLSQSWNLLRPADTYRFPDDGLGEALPDGWTTTFPHTLSRPAGADRIFYDNWKRTPFADEYVADMAIALSRDLGKTGSTDFLGVSFGVLDYVGHKFGPSSREVEDVLARLDVTLGRLFASLDASIGRDRYVVALSGDHGVVPLPEQSAAAGVDAGRIVAADIQPAIDAVLVRSLGAGVHFMPRSVSAGNASTDVYFTDAVLRQLARDPDLRRQIAAAVERVPGIARAVWPEELTMSDDRDVRALRYGYDPARSGDLLLVPKAYWYAGSSGTGHGSSYGYDQRVPMAFMGFGIRPGRYTDAVTPADIAPTLAYLAGVTLSAADGHLVRAAIR